MHLETEGLSVSYRDESGNVKEAAIDVSLSLGPGEVLGLVGESGSGKSSVALSIPRLLPSPPAFYPAGRILLDGEDVLKMSPSRLREIRGEKIGVVFQDPMGSLSPLWRIGDQLIETIRLHRGLSKAAAREHALEWLGKVALPDPERIARAYPHELSGGMQQRVMIAMSMLLSPELLIADEPTTALDVTVQKEILALMKKLHGRSSSLLVISHDLGVVSALATKIAVMKDGAVVETSDDMAAFFREQKHPYSRALVAAARNMSVHGFG